MPEPTAAYMPDGREASFADLYVPGASPSFVGVHSLGGSVIWQCGHLHDRRKYAENCATAALSAPSEQERE